MYFMVGGIGVFYLLLFSALWLITLWAGSWLKQITLEIRRGLLVISVLVNIGFLGFFKYFNFFAQSFVGCIYILLDKLSILTRLNIILPVGISFYTFQTLSYTIDVYRRKLEPTSDIICLFCICQLFSTAGCWSY